MSKQTRIQDAYHACVAARKARRNELLATILLAPVRLLGLAAAFLFEVLSSINPLVLLVYVLGSDD